jgi:hypothetical protein
MKEEGEGKIHAFCTMYCAQCLNITLAMTLDGRCCNYPQLTFEI